MADPADTAFPVQAQVRAPWRRHLDSLAPLRPALHLYCCGLTGNVWNGEDLAQDTLMRLFSLLGKIDADPDNPRGCLIRAATNLRIDRARRWTLEREFMAGDATSELLARLAPQERAAVFLAEVFALSLEETASALRTGVGAAKSALHRGRGGCKPPIATRPSPGKRPLANWSSDS